MCLQSDIGSIEAELHQDKCWRLFFSFVPHLSDSEIFRAKFITFAEFRSLTTSIFFECSIFQKKKFRLLVETSINRAFFVKNLTIRYF